MAQNQVNREKFCCPVCLELLKEPVTPACGHSYCRSCIKGHWDSEEQSGVSSYSCPQCRETFTPRPELRRNIVLAELIQELKETGLQAADHCAAPADHCAAAADHHCAAAGPEDVACDLCTGRKVKALKSCLVCLVSYCENHLQPHLDVAPLKKHKLVEPCEKLQENICPRHGEVMKMFCRSDQLCICHLCPVDQHKGHDVVSAAAERTERQKELEETRLKIQQRVQDSEREVRVLTQEDEDLRGSADGAVDHNHKIFAQLIQDLQRRSSEVTRQIRSRQETEERRVKELQEKLEQEITDLKRRDADLKQLAQTQDHKKFLQDYTSLTTLAPASTHSSSTRTRPPLRLFEDLTAAVSQVRGQIQEILTEADFSQAETTKDFLPKQPQTQTQPEKRADFLKYSREMILDPNTANKRLLISDGNRKVKYVDEVQSYSDHPDRFTHWCQVLGRESLTGRWYWEVERRGRGLELAVSYKNIGRAGYSDQCRFGSNERSWSLDCNKNTYNFYHNKIQTPVSGPGSSRFGVFLDHGAGLLSFYSVSDTMTLIHRVRTSFAQPLHAGVLVYPGSSAEFCRGAAPSLVSLLLSGKRLRENL